MNEQASTTLMIWATKPQGRLAFLLHELGLTVRAVEEDEGPVDRYIISERVAIERRTGSSFLQGIVDKSLFTSAIYLQEHFPVPILLVEGPFDYQHTSFNPQAVRGALSSMLLSYGVSVVSTTDTQESASLIAMMARQEQAGIPDISLVPKRKAADLPDMQRRIAEMFPGCGRTAARGLLQYFGSVRRIVNASTRELARVKGIGSKTASEIHRVLNAEYEAVDTERDLEGAIEAAPELLFAQPVTLLARQHHIYTERGERHIADMVFLDPAANELILVELKRGKLEPEHEDQLQRYLLHARDSALLREFLEKGTGLRGILSTVTRCDFEPRSRVISVRLVDERQAINVLCQRREQRLHRPANEPPEPDGAGAAL